MPTKSNIVHNPLFIESTDISSSSNNGISAASSSSSLPMHPLFITTSSDHTKYLLDTTNNNDEELYSLLSTVQIIKPSMKLPYRLRLGSIFPAILSIICASISASSSSWGSNIASFFNQKFGIEFFPFQMCSYGTYGDDDTDPPLGCTTISPHLVFKSDPTYSLYGSGIVSCITIPLTLLSIISLFCFPRIFITPWPTILTALPVIGHIINLTLMFHFRYTFLASDSPTASHPQMGFYAACCGIFCSFINLVLVIFAEHHCYKYCDKYYYKICCKCCSCPVPKIDDNNDNHHSSSSSVQQRKLSTTLIIINDNNNTSRHNSFTTHHTTIMNMDDNKIKNNNTIYNGDTKDTIDTKDTRYDRTQKMINNNNYNDISTSINSTNGKKRIVVSKNTMKTNLSDTIIDYE